MTINILMFFNYEIVILFLDRLKSSREETIQNPTGLQVVELVIDKEVSRRAKTANVSCSLIARHITIT